MASDCSRVREVRKTPQTHCFQESAHFENTFLWSFFFAFSRVWGLLLSFLKSCGPWAWFQHAQSHGNASTRRISLEICACVHTFDPGVGTFTAVSRCVRMPRRISSLTNGTQNHDWQSEHPCTWHWNRIELQIHSKIYHSLMCLYGSEPCEQPAFLMRARAASSPLSIDNVLGDIWENCIDISARAGSSPAL
jgi:hypothetical protein